MNIPSYAKAVVAGVIGVLTVLATVITDGNLSVDDGIVLAGAVLTAFGVWKVPNREPVE